jgi:hypothetical protein
MADKLDGRLRIPPPNNLFDRRRKIPALFGLAETDMASPLQNIPGKEVAGKIVAE